MDEIKELEIGFQVCRVRLFSMLRQISERDHLLILFNVVHRDLLSNNGIDSYEDSKGGGLGRDMWLLNL